ncbi:alpha/beta hydrolase [Actinophytocola xanthii]|uniref:Alpha/beta hydrolase n=1 Tax=Actinophytocola xanthii TaxID=1912961 RepID=A0A1Q8CAK4_9PSEU|nr:alpha/beta hydrolase [Actinophytocola xanthii]
MVLPGGRYGAHAPLLSYAADAAEARGARIRYVHWDPPYDPERVPPESTESWVVNQVPAVPGRPLLVGKSLGTHAAGLAADRSLPAVWLTPLLTVDPVLEGLRRASAPVLLVGGTADRFWDGRLARELSPHVLEVDGADHGMYVPGRLAASAAVLGRVATAVEDFLDEVVWPGTATALA